MPAVVDDPASPTIYRVSGQPPFPDPNNPGLPADIVPRHVTLRDRQTVATVVPFASRHQAPDSLIRYLCDQYNREIEGGDTYPMIETFTVDDFATFWFQNFGAVMILGDLEGPASVIEGGDWARDCLGSFYIKPNYPGRSSHVCNAGFLVTEAARNRGVGRLMGETYLDWAPRLGYTYSVFNLVYDTNVASCKIWDALGFKRIGRVKGCGNLKSYPDRLIDAIIYGRDLSPSGDEELVSEERFDKIKYYLKYGNYPNGADRAEKSRLRSAATHYKLIDGDKLMLKDKEVISDPARQYDIARGVHVLQHGGINKTTATIAEKYHWSRIKETVSDVIRNCVECRELGKSPNPGGSGAARKAAAVPMAAVDSNGVGGTPASMVTPPSVAAVGSTGSGTVAGMADEGGSASAMVNSSAAAEAGMFMLQEHDIMSTLPQRHSTSPGGYANPSDISVLDSSHAFPASAGNQPALGGASPQPHSPRSPHAHISHTHHAHNPMLQDQPQHHHPQAHASPHNQPSPHPHHGHQSPVYQPIDPQMISQSPSHHAHVHDHNHNHHHHPHEPDDNDTNNPFDNYDDNAHDAADFQALLSATENDDDVHAATVDRDLDMLIEQQDDEVDQVKQDGFAMSSSNRHGSSAMAAERHNDNGRDRSMYDVDFGESGG